MNKLYEKLTDPDYRKAFVSSQITFGIAFQIRALLKSRSGWTQTTLAQKANMKQPQISGLLTSGKTRPNIETLRKIAEAFDCGLLVRFCSFSELAKWSDTFDPDSFNVPGFESDAGFFDSQPQIAEIIPQPCEQTTVQLPQGAPQGIAHQAIRDTAFYIGAQS